LKNLQWEWLILWLPGLSEEEQNRIEQYWRQIDIADVKMVNSYGASAQKGISTFSTTITSRVAAKDFGDVGVSLRELRVAINSTTETKKKGIFGFLQKGKQKATFLISNYESAETSIKKIEKDLQ
jgi:uncharacterized protein YaaN involved in tellurite resistance